MSPDSNPPSSKASSLSSLSSLSRSSSSLSQKAASVKSIVKKGAKALVRPFKKAKTRLSTHLKSSSTTRTSHGGGNSSDTTNNPILLDHSSDIEIVEADPEKDLSASAIFQSAKTYSHLLAEALKKSWRSPIYSFFKSDGISIQYHDGRLCHFFPCAALKCKSTTGGVRRFQDSKDKSSTANLKHHANQCFGEEAVNNAIGGKPGITPSASIFSLFANEGQKPVHYSHRAHTNPEVRYVY
jgi:hypothetical protein